MQVLSGAQAAEMLGVSTRRLYQLAKEGDPPPKDSAGKYPAREYAVWLMEREISKKGIQPDGKVLDLQAERARLAKEQADKTAMENGRLRGELAPVGAARKLLESVGSTFKTRILSIPSKLAPAIIGLKTLPEVRELIEEYLHDALHELSRLTEADLGSAAGPAGGTPAAEADNKRVGRPRKKIKS